MCIWFCDGSTVAWEIQWGKDGMREQQYAAEYGDTVAYCLRLAEECCFVNGRDVKEGFNKGNAQFRNAKAAAKAGQCDKIAILQVNNNKALFPMDFIEYALKDMPMVHGAHIYLKVFILLHLCMLFN